MDRGKTGTSRLGDPPDLDETTHYAKERRLLDEVQRELAHGRRVQVYAVYTQKRDVTRRLQSILRESGVRAEVLTADTPPEQREAWYERHLRSGMQVCICHPKLVQTGLDYVEYGVGGDMAFLKPVVGLTVRRAAGACFNAKMCTVSTQYGNR